MYTVLENVRIVISLLKKHNIRKIVLSPGGSNVPVVQAVQQDPFFQCYSIVDERSAMYFAIGLYLETGEIIATSCTSANATRNYIPALTEAFYKHVPILAITMSKHQVYWLQEYMQCPIQTSLPIDSVKKSFSLPRINDENDREMCIRATNEAILELTHHRKGPVQLNIEELDSETWHFKNTLDLPDVRAIYRFGYDEKWEVSLKEKKILLLIGEHMPFEPELESLIETFCKYHNVFVYADNIANYHGDYALQANILVCGMTLDYFLTNLRPDIVITIGGITGDYPIYNLLSGAPQYAYEHWRISPDGDVVDTYRKLTKVFACSEKYFFSYFENDDICNHDYYEKWNDLYSRVNFNLDIPFSNLYVAQSLYKKLPQNSRLNLAILNSLRAWFRFPVDSSIKCYSNVASFGIDGCMSTFFGESVETEELCFHVTGDLSFFYDMNSIGIRHIKNNVRIILVNNGGGAEFKLGYLQHQIEVGKFISADGHYKNAKGWVETQGFKYIAADSKKVFEQHLHEFISPSERPILFEIFTNPEDEKKANDLMVQENSKEYMKGKVISQLSSKVKETMGDENIGRIKNILGR